MSVQTGETVGRVSWGSGGIHEGSGTETAVEKKNLLGSWCQCRFPGLSQSFESAGLGDSAVGGAVKHSLVLGFPGEESASVEGRSSAQRAAGREEPPGRSWAGTRTFILDLMQGS